MLEFCCCRLQALQQAQRLAALKQQTPEQQTPAQQQQQNDHSVRSRQPTRTGHAHFNADGTLTMQDSQSLDQDAAKGTTMYRNDMALPDPVPTTSPRDPPGGKLSPLIVFVVVDMNG